MAKATSLTKEERGILYNEYLQEREKKGITQNQFCKKRKINPVTFKNWAPFVKLVKAGAAKSATNDLQVVLITEKKSTSKNAIKAAAKTTASKKNGKVAPLEVHLPNGVVVFVPPDASTSSAQALIEALSHSSIRQ